MGVVETIKKKSIKHKCVHGKQASTRCAECLGHPVQWKIVKKCPHNLIKSRCEECVGHPITKRKQSSRCPHDKHSRTRCAECLGHPVQWKTAKMCQHNSMRKKCEICTGHPILKQKQKPARLCEHGCARKLCRICSPQKYCLHKRLKYTCVVCSGANLCSHLKIKSTCYECKKLGGKITKRIYKNCVHNIPRNTCKICGWMRICPHQKRRSLCLECGGSSFCDCDGGKMKNVCPKHGGSELCVNCIHWPDPQHKNSHYGNYCARCFNYKWPDDPKSKQCRGKIKENLCKKFLQDNQIPFVNDRAVLDRDTSCDKSASRPDFQVQHTHQELVSIHIEVDENQHKSYEGTCELVRLNNIAVSHQYRRPLVVLRYNPDPFNVGAQRITYKELQREDKEQILLQQLKKVIEGAAYPENFPALLRVIKIGYDCECINTTVCGCVHSKDYKDQESIRIEYNLMK